MQDNKDMTNYKRKWTKNRQCKYNATWRRIRGTLLQWNNNKSYIFWVCM